MGKLLDYSVTARGAELIVDKQILFVCRAYTKVKCRLRRAPIFHPRRWRVPHTCFSSREEEVAPIPNTSVPCRWSVIKCDKNLHFTCAPTCAPPGGRRRTHCTSVGLCYCISSQRRTQFRLSSVSGHRDIRPTTESLLGEDLPPVTRFCFANADESCCSGLSSVEPK